MKTAIGGLLFLISQTVFSTVRDIKVKHIEVPAYNLISDTLVGMSAPTNGKRNDFVMQLICDLARGDKTQEEVNATLVRNNVDIESIPQSKSISSLLINGKKADQAATCAAYIATSLLVPTDNTALFDKKKSNDGKEEVVLNAARFAEEMKVKMSVAQATANLYAIIASNLDGNSNQSFTDYQENIAKTVYNYAPEYLHLVQTLYINDRAAYTPRALTKSTLVVEDNLSRELQVDPQGFVLKSRGVIWLGEAKILGKEFFVPLNIIIPPEEKKKSKTIKRTLNK
ncbi:hypothetical protein ACEU59_19980 [Buttiauxella noackiae]|uniref:hypothetical protein n=1 Tax=Buttiauxella noackiae TaxID=82992 RepID=UPI0035A6EE3F